jgi:broad specificity phosphatase PhoE
VNGKGLFIHDSPITEYGKSRTVEITKNSLGSHGIPSAIVCSPYRRARETALIMQEYINSTCKVDIPIYCDVTLSEYLGNRTSEPLNVTPETLLYDPPHPETWTQFMSRIAKHNNSMKYLDELPTFIWFVTHGLVVTSLSRLNGNKTRKNIPPLGNIVLPRHYDHQPKDIKSKQITPVAA